MRVRAKTPHDDFIKSKIKNEKIETHGRGVHEVVPNGRSEGGLVRGMTEGTSRRVVMFLSYPPTP